MVIKQTTGPTLFWSFWPLCPPTISKLNDDVNIRRLSGKPNSGTGLEHVGVVIVSLSSYPHCELFELSNDGNSNLCLFNRERQCVDTGWPDCWSSPTSRAHGPYHTLYSCRFSNVLLGTIIEHNRKR